MANGHGGVRSGSGRKKGSIGISQQVKQLFAESAHNAAQSIIAISQDKDHPQQLKALDIVLTRGLGQPQSTKEHAMDEYLNGQMSATQTALILESAGGAIGDTLKQYVRQEIDSVRPDFMSDELPVINRDIEG